MHVSIEPGCIGCGLCASTCPAVFEMDADGLAKVAVQPVPAVEQAAREAAAQFAKDSESKLGKIKTATQGYFSIDDADPSTPYIKNIRVVTNVTYYLED